jgi:LCP family protein required for cell wall assembly
MPSESGIPKQVVPSERKEGKYTFLVLASDAGYGNTDTIMVVTFDAIEYSVEVASIPRDTVVNVNWSLKKANSIWANMRLKHGKGDEGDANTMEAVVDAFADFIGYDVDRWMLVDLKAFTKLVEKIGGVDFYVPVNMSYDDDAQNLHIHYSKGMQHLSGQQALEVVRFRRYASADIGRINTQQDFLTTAIKQILANRDSLDAFTLAGIFKDYVKTDMSVTDIIWFAEEFFKMDSENVNFVTMPGNYIESIRGESYVTVYVDEWLEIVNDKLNPWTKQITASDVSILTRGTDKKLFVTDGNIKGSASWGGGISGSGTSRSSDSGGSGSGSGSGGNSGGGGGGNSNSGSGGNSGGGGNSGSGGGGNPSSSPPNSPQPTPSGSPGGNPGEEPENSPAGGPENRPDASTEESPDANAGEGAGGQPAEGGETPDGAAEPPTEPATDTDAAPPPEATIGEPSVTAQMPQEAEETQ